MPIFTFVNKMDRPGREAFDLIGEVEHVLGIGVYPMTWPIYSGATFRGVYHRGNRHIYMFDAKSAGSSQLAGSEVASMTVSGVDDPRLEEELGAEGYKQMREEAELLDAAGDAFDRKRFEAGEVSPMFFGSAMNNFGISPFLDSFIELMPPPPGRVTSKGQIDPLREPFSGFIFKIQANMDKSHRDRVAFLRICSGRFERGMKVRHVRTAKDIRLSNPTTFVAQERTIVEDAYAADVIGVYDPGIFEIGDTLTAGSDFTFEEIPSFAPEHFSRVVMIDPLRRKQLKKGLEQLSQEGTIQLYRPIKGAGGGHDPRRGRAAPARSREAPPPERVRRGRAPRVGVVRVRALALARGRRRPRHGVFPPRQRRDRRGGRARSPGRPLPRRVAVEQRQAPVPRAHLRRDGPRRDRARGVIRARG